MKIRRGTSDSKQDADAARRVVGRGGEVLLLSMRRVANLGAYCLMYEFEDVIGATTGADRVDVGAEEALHRSRRAYKLLRMMSNSHSLARRVAPNPSTVRLDRDYELFLPTFNHAHELYALATVPDWRKRCRVAACYINEVWAHLLPPYLLEMLGQFDHIFLGTRHCVEQVNRITGVPCSYLPLAADVLRFSPWPHPPGRTVDVCYLGRRSDITHQALIRMAEDRGIYYHHDTLQMQSRQRTFRVASVSEHRLMLSGLLQRSRYYIANRARINEPDVTRNREEISGHFYEGAAAGTVMLGEAPNTVDFRQQFDWPDAVIYLPFHSNDVADVLKPLDADPARLTRASRLNVHHAALRHDWLYRLQHVFASFNLKPTAAMLERQQRLHRLADQALQGPQRASAA